VIRRLVTPIALAAALVIPVTAAAKVRVAASLNDFASIAKSVGGDNVEVFAVARATANAHRVEALPSYMVRVSRAQIYLKVGLGLDLWADAIIDGSRNQRLTIVDCSRDVRVLEVPTTRVNASMGDVHPNGNPHYWLDPRNGAVIARNIADALSRADPSHAASYRERAEAFAKEAEAAWQQGKERADALPAQVVFTYHRSWSYFADAFGLEVAGTVEPVPGIPPTARHLAQLVRIAKSRPVRLLLQEPYFSDDAARFLARQAGVRAVVAAPSCDAPTAGSYLTHFSGILQAMSQKAGELGTP
jgi:zinc/manganese transport system substrate-binding protein